VFNMTWTLLRIGLESVVADAASERDHQMAIALLREDVRSDGCSKDRSCALRSMAEVGLSARTREKTGHCSNAGGLSAV
jgi:hypothetical protein